MTSGQPSYRVEIVDYVNGRKVVTWAVPDRVLPYAIRSSRTPDGEWPSRRQAKAVAAALNSARWGSKPKAKARVVNSEDSEAAHGLLRNPAGDAA